MKKDKKIPVINHSKKKKKKKQKKKPLATLCLEVAVQPYLE